MRYDSPKIAVSLNRVFVISGVIFFFKKEIKSKVFLENISPELSFDNRNTIR